MPSRRHLLAIGASRGVRYGGGGAGRLTSLWLGAVAGAATILLVVSALYRTWGYRLWAWQHGPSLSRAVEVLQRWSRRACRWLRLEVRVQGPVPGGPCLYVANHRSYLDIPVLANVLGATFVSRADVARWPVFGAAATAAGVVFVDRDDFAARVGAARALARRLRSASVIVFPEGTTTGERLPADFHSGVFRLLRRLGARVVPVTIRYGHRRAYWTDDVSLARHLFGRVFAPLPLVTSVHVGAPLPADAVADAASLARTVYAAVCRPIEELGEFV